jgi:AraC-like DNA-binding protein
MHHSMNVCFAIEGTVGLKLKESNFSTSLSEHQHHFIYSPESRYDIVTTKNVHGFHLSIDLDYYTNLLSDHEAFTSDVRNKLLKKETAWAGKASMNLNMKQALQDIVHNPLAGNSRSLLIEAKVLEVVALQLNQFSAGDKVCPVKRAETEAFYALKEYLDQHFADDLSLRGLSRTFGMNEFKLKKGFKELFSNTIFEYIHDLKMTYARELLLDHKKYVNEVSSLVGYKNPNHFSTAFKRKFGTSPSALK